ncbi:hypothetical protein L208DRAFT_1357668 [Tricholoma matsutake]|nr:hypothetical protein L208DRAFT_1357668 [Tricholoma matsutake 945]
MLFKSFITVTFFAYSLAIAPRATLDVWAPTILEPDASTIWQIGKCENVTWDTSNAPVNISNGSGVLLSDVNRKKSWVLASDFDLRAGSVKVEVPSVTPGDYFVTLFGDSGDTSPPFSIQPQ